MHDLKRPPATTPPLYAQDGKGYQALVHAHYFLAGCDWLVTEYDPEEDRAFGWACLHLDRQNAELGYVLIRELDAVSIGPGGMLRVDYEEGWEPIPLQEAIALLDRRQGLVRE